MKEFENTGPSEDEMVEVLTAISIVSGRLARNMSALAEQRKNKEGEKQYEQDRRHRYDSRRDPQCCSNHY